jgi:hypothetical protein
MTLDFIPEHGKLLNRKTAKILHNFKMCVKAKLLAINHKFSHIIVIAFQLLPVEVVQIFLLLPCCKWVNYYCRAANIFAKKCNVILVPSNFLVMMH